MRQRYIVTLWSLSGTWSWSWDVNVVSRYCYWYPLAHCAVSTIYTQTNVSMHMQRILKRCSLVLSINQDSYQPKLPNFQPQNISLNIKIKIFSTFFREYLLNIFSKLMLQPSLSSANNCHFCGWNDKVGWRVRLESSMDFSDF